MGGLVTFLVLLAAGIIFGRMNEQRHFQRLDAEEAALAHVKVYNLKSVPESHAKELLAGGTMVTGNVVIAVDYFKVIVASLKTIIGGRLRSYESLVERARREAILRMKKEADELGATAIYNARIEFSVIGQQPKASGAELLAYGTAVKAAQVSSNA